MTYFCLLYHYSLGFTSIVCQPVWKKFEKSNGRKSKSEGALSRNLSGWKAFPGRGQRGAGRDCWSHFCAQIETMTHVLEANSSKHESYWAFPRLLTVSVGFSWQNTFTAPFVRSSNLCNFHNLHTLFRKMTMKFFVIQSKNLPVQKYYPQMIKREKGGGKIIFFYKILWKSVGQDVCTPVWKRDELGQLYSVLGKLRNFVGSKMLHPHSHSKWGKVYSLDISHPVPDHYYLSRAPHHCA